MHTAAIAMAVLKHGAVICVNLHGFCICVSQGRLIEIISILSS